jgi:hypothetical protein
LLPSLILPFAIPAACSLCDIECQGESPKARRYLLAFGIPPLIIRLAGAR